MNMATNIVNELWHRRLCHMSEKGMQRLANDNLIPKVKNMEPKKCTDYLPNKQNITSF